jgi:drug/metabolite transporter (DMT)-like permease
MYHYLFGITMLKSISPYFRKHVLNHLDSHDFFFINTLFIFSILSLFFIYRYLFDKSFDQSVKKITSMKFTHLGCIFAIAVLTIVSSITIMELDKNYNTPFINSILMRIFSTIALVLVSIFIFKEKYTRLQILGICMTIAGVFLISNKSI